MAQWATEGADGAPRRVCFGSGTVWASFHTGPSLLRPGFPACVYIPPGLLQPYFPAAFLEFQCSKTGSDDGELDVLHPVKIQ